ncbi:excinuclease ABC subunit B, partial [archaeon]|nr:excinuclease ABC subunit B [archaeon]
YEDTVIQIEMFGDQIETIKEIDPVSNKKIKELKNLLIFPAKHFVMPEEKTTNAIESIKKELKETLKTLIKQNKLVEAQRLEQRTNYDIEMLNEIGHCQGIENYSRHFEGRKKGTPPSTLIDFFGEDFLIVLDESHVTLPQLHGMYKGDYSRKKNLIDHGFRLPSAYDNRPLKFNEFEKHIKNIIYVSATPKEYEKEESTNIAEQIVRPTGLLDPKIIIRKAKGQVADVTEEIKAQAKKGLRTLVTTLTKKQSEDLTDYLTEKNIKVRYLHSDIDTLERTDIIRDLRLGEFDCLVGVNLLREGLDMPEVSLVAILDADKEGFLRNTTSLIQTMGRASRNAKGRAILYADKMTKSIDEAVFETKRRRKIQEQYNQKHNITPKTITKTIHERITTDEEKTMDYSNIPKKELEFVVQELESQMNLAAEELEFEKAAKLRDQIKELKEKM